MGIIGWMMYILLGIIFFFIISFINNRYDITKIEKLVLSIILLMIVAGIFSRLGLHFNSDIFLIFVFLLITDIIYSSYFTSKDFFDKSEGNISYYVVLILLGYFINQEFINQVESVFLTGEDFRLVLWFLVLIFIYNFCNKYNLFKNIKNDEVKYMSKESILVNYTKLKYKYMDVCNYKNKDIENIIYSIMIYQNNKRSKLLRNYDYFMFRLNGNPRKLGIMQVETKKFISDSDSIDLVYKKIEKLYNNKSKISSLEVLKSYCKDYYSEVKYIFDTIKKF